MEPSRTEHVKVYYTSAARMDALFAKNARQMGLREENLASPQVFLEWKERLREKLREVTGIQCLESCDLTPQILEETDMGNYTRRKILLQTEPTVFMPVYVLIPKKKREHSPCVIATHGHGSSGKNAIAYRTEIPSVKEMIEKYNYTYGIRLVEMGYTVFCPDARGFGERREKRGQTDEEHAFLNSTCAELNRMAISLGLSLTGLWIWDLMRLVDYIRQNPETSRSRIGCVGLSGGGLQCLWLSALDDRIACGVVSGYFYGYGDSLLRMPGNCSCNYVPGLWKVADMGDIGALIAPRPLLVETGTVDHLNGARGVTNAKEQVAVTRQAYAVFGSQEKLVHDIFEGPHRFHGEKAYPFMEMYLG